MNKNKVTSHKLQVTKKCKHSKLAACRFSLVASSGFTLLEVVIYIAIFSMIVVTLIPLAYVSFLQDQKTSDGVINAYENK